MATKKAAGKIHPKKATKVSPRKSAKKSAQKTTTTNSNAVDAQLAKYRSMRDFKITAEPSGSPKSKSPRQLPFVIQKHAASHLHYDFRLGWNGVLKSWAVAKGPSYNVKDRRLAVQVEDHPMEYGGFEGIIPKGQYGGGTVMLWDQGTWEPQPESADVDAALKAGSLKFVLHGTRLKGKWTLIRMNQKPGSRWGSSAKPNWLLIKEHDDYERSPNDPCITEEAPNSVVTNRSLDQIAANSDHVWNSKDTASSNQPWFRNDNPADTPSATQLAPPSATRPGAPDLSHLEIGVSRSATKPKVSKNPNPPPAPKLTIPTAAAKESLPTFITPQLALQATTPPTSDGWLHELKLDGYRIQARKDGANVQLLTRNGLDWTHRMQSIAAQVADLPCKSALLDGEVVVLAPDGNTNFADLQASFQEGVNNPLTYFIFDLLHLDGHNLRNLPLITRKELLAQLLPNAGDFIRLSEHLTTDGPAMFHKACELHAEGIISKRANSTYASGRSPAWLKLKCVHEQEFVIGGFTLPGKGHAGIHGIGALLLGYYAGGKLIYAGRTGTGFTQKTHKIIRDQLEPLRQSATPFDKPPAEARKDAIWVKPKLVAQVNFATWTADNLVRQASFKGIREDKPATEVRREEPKMFPRKFANHPAPTPIAAKTEAAKEPRPLSAKTTTKRGSWNLKPAPIRLTHPEKILDPESQLTKQQLADYLWTIAPLMLPHVAGRPLSLVRCPEGSSKPCFFQKHVNHMLPPGIEGVDVPDKKTGKVEPYITLSTPEALAGLAQMGVLEVHPWGSRNDNLEHPDRIIIDLDPDPAISWSTLAESAGSIRAQLKSLGLESFLKTTGGKGLHLVIPIEPKTAWPEVKEFAHKFVLALEQQSPKLYLTKMSKAARKDRIFLDYLRNERGATAVAAYSPRARAGAPVALPLHWSDLILPDRPHFELTHYNDWKERLKRDPWKHLPTTRQSL